MFNGQSGSSVLPYFSLLFLVYHCFYHSTSYWVRWNVDYNFLHFEREREIYIYCLLFSVSTSLILTASISFFLFPARRFSLSRYILWINISLDRRLKKNERVLMVGKWKLWVVSERERERKWERIGKREKIERGRRSKNWIEETGNTSERTNIRIESYLRMEISLYRWSMVIFTVLYHWNDQSIRMNLLANNCESTERNYEMHLLS